MKMSTGTHRSNTTLRSLCARVNVNGRSGCPCRTFLRKINSAHLLFFVLLFLLYEHVLIFSSWEEKSKWSYTYSHFEETCLHKNQILLCMLWSVFRLKFFLHLVGMTGDGSIWAHLFSKALMAEPVWMQPLQTVWCVMLRWRQSFRTNHADLETGRVSLNDYGMSAEERQEQSCLSSTMKNILYLQYSK